LPERVIFINLPLNIILTKRSSDWTLPVKGKRLLFMSHRVAFLLGISCHLLFAVQSSAQQIPPDSVFYSSSVSNLYHTYLAQIGENARLYNGPEYIRNGVKASGFAFFQTDSMLSGSVSYNGLIYPDLSLYYDLVPDELVTFNYTHVALIGISKENVDSFIIDGHHFIRLKAGHANGTIPGDGYYEQLAWNEPAVYVRREKKLLAPSGYEDPKYRQYNTYYLKMNNSFYEVGGKKELLDLLKDHKDEVKNFIRTNKLNFKKRFEEAIVRVSVFYSQIKN
jgi:hypothetical protein